MPDITTYLNGLKIPKESKAELWDAFDQSSSADDLATRIGGLSVDRAIKAQLWDMKSAPASAPIPEAAKTAVPPMPNPPIPFGLRKRSPIEEAQLAGLGGPMLPEAEGAKQMAESQGRGVAEASAGAGQLFGKDQPLERRAMGASRMFRGGAQAAAPLLIPAMGAAALAAPAATAVGLGIGTAMQEGVERGAKAIGVPEGFARVAGDVAGMPGYLYGPFRALRPKVPLPQAASAVDDAIPPPVQVPDPPVQVPVPAPRPFSSAQGTNPTVPFRVTGATRLGNELVDVNIPTAKAGKKIEGPLSWKPPKSSKKAPDAPTQRSVPRPEGDIAPRPVGDVPPAKEAAPANTGAAELPEVKPQADIVSSFREIEPSADKLIGIAKLRERFPDASKEEFDSAVLKAYGDGDLMLHETAIHPDNPEITSSPTHYITSPHPGRDSGRIVYVGAALTKKGATAGSPAITQSPAAVTARLPKELAGAKPRYAYGEKKFELQFESDVDRAAYITAQSKPSKRDADFLSFAVKASGMSEAEVRQRGASLRDQIKSMAKNAEPGVLRVPSVRPVSPARRESQRGSFSRRPLSKQPKGPEDDYLNFGRIRVSPEEDQILRGTLRGMIDRGEISKDVEPHESIIRAAANLDPALVREISAEARSAGLTGRAAVHAMRQRTNALADEMNKVGQQMLDPAIGPEARAALDGRFNALERDLKEYIKVTYGLKRESGRDLAALNIMADKTLDLGWWVQQAAKAEGKTPDMLSDADRREIQNLIAGVKDAIAKNDGAAAKKARIALATKVHKMKESGWWETSATLFKAGLLTGVRTHMGNVGGTSLFQGAEEAARIPGAFADMAMALYSKRRTTTGASLPAMAHAAKEAATRGASEAVQILRQGGTNDALLKGDLPRELNFQKLRNLAEKQPDGLLKETLGRTNDMVNAYGRGVFRLLGAEDRIQRVYAMRRSLEAQAKVMAMNEARANKGVDVKARTAELVKNPTDLMISESIASGEFATFNSRNLVSTVTSRGKSALPPSGRAVVDTQIPFVNTPAEVAARMFNYMPGTNFIPAVRTAVKVGAEKSAAKVKAAEGSITQQELASIITRLGDRQQKAIAESFGRGVVGTSILLTGYLAAKAGLATGMFDSEEKAGIRNVEKAAGREDGAILVNGKWRSIGRFAPIGSLFIIGASLFDQETKSLDKSALNPLRAAEMGTRTLMEQPFLQGPQEAFDVLRGSEEGKIDKLMATKAGAVVPTIVSDLSRIVDPNRKESKPPSGWVAPMVYGIQNRTPFRASIPNAQDVFGRDLGGSRGFAVDPFMSSPAKEVVDPMLKQLLADNFGVSKLREIKGESPDHLRSRRMLRGTLVAISLRQAMDQGLPEDPKERKRALQQAVREANKELDSLMENENFLNETEERRAQIMAELAQEIRQ